MIGTELVVAALTGGAVLVSTAFTAIYINRRKVNSLYQRLFGMEGDDSDKGHIDKMHDKLDNLKGEREELSKELEQVDRRIERLDGKMEMHHDVLMEEFRNGHQEGGDIGSDE